MAQIFVQGNARMSFDGTAVFAQDAAALGTPIAFADQRIAFVRSDNNSYPDLIDGAAFPVNKVPGIKLGQLQVSGVVQPDRGVDAWINAAFGPRTAGQLPPWVMSLIPYAGGAAIKATGVYWNTLRIFASFGVSGGQSMVEFVATAYVVDPDNFYAAPALVVPAYVGTAGAGIAPFARASFTNDGPTSYDQIRAFDLALTNGMQIIPGVKNAAQRIAQGFMPAAIKGAMTLTQLSGAVNPIPQTSGTYPLDIVLPSGNGAKVLTLATSQSYDSGNTSLSPTDFYGSGVNFSLFGTSLGATATAGYPLVASAV